ITERGNRTRRVDRATRLRQWLRARKFEAAPCPPTSKHMGNAAIVLVAIDIKDDSLQLADALRDMVRRIAAADERCRIACVTTVPPAATLKGERYEETA